MISANGMADGDEAIFGFGDLLEDDYSQDDQVTKLTKSTGGNSLSSTPINRPSGLGAVKINPLFVNSDLKDDGYEKPESAPKMAAVSTTATDKPSAYLTDKTSATTTATNVSPSSHSRKHDPVAVWMAQRQKHGIASPRGRMRASSMSNLSSAEAQREQRARAKERSQTLRPRRHNKRGEGLHQHLSASNVSWSNKSKFGSMRGMFRSSTKHREHICSAIPGTSRCECGRKW